jgi:anti-sigma B factor antagonist
MRFETELVNDIIIVSPPKVDLDAGNAEEFKKDIAGATDKHSKVIMNLEPIGFMDSAGLGAMLSAYKKVRAEGGQFRIFGLNKDVKALFELVRMHRLFEIYEDKQSAVASFGA